MVSIFSGCVSEFEKSGAVVLNQIGRMLSYSLKGLEFLSTVCLPLTFIMLSGKTDMDQEGCLTPATASLPGERKLSNLV